MTPKREHAKTRINIVDENGKDVGMSTYITGKDIRAIRRVPVIARDGEEFTQIINPSGFTIRCKETPEDISEGLEADEARLDREARERRK